jgi:nicotinate-nucleotide adenylyltransferase
MGKSVNNMATALFGGTFNPIHFGHLTIASELADLLQVDKIQLIPCAFPPHRGQPQASAKQRLAMLELAINRQPKLTANPIELHRDAPSYSIDTVTLLREQIGDQQPLFFCIGLDSLVTLPSWHRWQELLDYCHIVVASRPGTKLPAAGPLIDWIAENNCEDLSTMQQQPAGSVYFCNLSMLDISSTDIRDKLAKGQDIDFLTPTKVVEYIQQHHLYE